MATMSQPHRVSRARPVPAAAVLVAAAAWGAASGVLLPRGPLSGAEAIISVAVSAAVGAAIGWVLPRWYWRLAGGAVFVLALELARLGVSGPTVDWPAITTYGVIAFVTGRGVQFFFTLLPMGLAAEVCAAWRRAGVRESGRSKLSAGTATALAAALLVGLCAVVAIPGRTAAIAGPDGQPLDGSVAELTQVDILGHDQGLMIRGRDATAPVLLFLAGGPGGSELGAMRNDAGLEQHFVVATWDQRGTGRSYRQLDPTDTLTLESSIADAIAVTEYLRERFGVEKIYLSGQSWGSLLGALTVQRRPDLFHAFIGTGQMVSIRETDQLMYADTLEWARRTGQSGIVAQLEEIGQPPYSNLLHYETAFAYEPMVYPFDHSPNAEGAGGFSEHIFAAEYAPLERIHNLGAMLDTFAALYPRVQDADLRRDAARLEVPVYLLQGRHEPRARNDLAVEWFELLDAPHKEWIELDTSGHRPIFQQPAEFTRVLAEQVLPPE